MSDWSISKLIGRIIKVDLTKRKISLEDIDEKVIRKFLGGRGLNQLLLYQNLETDISPLDPENYILFGSGLFAGTGLPGCIRLNVDTKNYFTGGIGSANVGGDFGRELKLAGYSTVMVTGKAEQSVYLSIDDDNIEIKEAEDIWGKKVSETTNLIEEKHGDDGSVLCIGPAGENLVRGASVMVDKARAAAKCGIGSVMGSKNLKAIWVKGSKNIEVRNEEKFEHLFERSWKKVRRSSSAKNLNEYGTLSVSSKNEIGGVPYRHYQDGFINQDELKKIDKHSFKAYEKRRFSATDCPIECRAIYNVKTGTYEGTEGEGMEANTIQDFGFKLDVTYPPAIIKAQVLCNDLGMDMDTVAESLAWAFECYEKGIIDKKDTNGFELTWGNHEAMVDLIEKIAYRNGFGDILAEGVQRASEIIGKGSEDLSVSMKGQDVYETIRMPKGYGLGAALSTRGGGHCSGSPLTEFSNGQMDTKKALEIYGVETAGDPHTYEGKAKLVADHERFHAVLNSLGMCFFSSTVNSSDLLNWDDITKLISVTTGWDIEKEELIEIGERIHNLERYFNSIHAGFDRKDDYPPDRFFTDKIKSGPYKGEKLDIDKFDMMLSENYDIHGWDEKGIPSKDRLDELGLDDFIDYRK
ncbi:MAG: aldehyde ferredoxin oxidoreductase family protein [Thermoplasmatota archaeon]